MSSKGTIVVTGATGGYARYYAHEMIKAWPEARIILFYRSESKLRHLPPESDYVDYRELEMNNLDAVRAAAQRIAHEIKAGKLPPISTILVNAAMMRLSRPIPRMAPGGTEETITVNHLAHYLMLRGLLGSVHPEGSRIITIGSGGYRPDYRFYPYKSRYRGLEAWLHPRLTKELDAKPLAHGMRTYGESKLAQVMISKRR